jgi:hypothetical protein
MVSPTILSVRQRTVSHTRITTAALSFTLSGLMATPDPSLALTTLHFTFTPSPPLEKKFGVVVAWSGKKIFSSNKSRI